MEKGVKRKKGGVGWVSDAARRMTTRLDGRDKRERVEGYTGARV